MSIIKFCTVVLTSIIIKDSIGLNGTTWNTLITMAMNSTINSVTSK